VLYEPLSRAKRASKKISSSASMKIIGIYLIYSVMSQAYVFKHNVDTARKYAYPLWLSDYIAYLNVLHIYFFLNEYTHMRKCVWLDTRLALGLLLKICRQVPTNSFDHLWPFGFLVMFLLCCNII